jgi:hypothetical protein
MWHSGGRFPWTGAGDYLCAATALVQDEISKELSGLPLKRPRFPAARKRHTSRKIKQGRYTRCGQLSQVHHLKWEKLILNLSKIRVEDLFIAIIHGLPGFTPN